MRRMETTLTVRRPAELLSYVPYRLGYPPRESLVVVSLRPPRHQVGLVVRVDLDDVVEPRGGRGLVRTVARHLERDGADALVVVVYSERTGEQVDEALDVLDDELGQAAPVVDRWLVTADGYRNLDCRDPRCCPPQGRPLTEVSASELAARLVYAGVPLAASREHAYGLPSADDAARRSVRRSAARAAQRRRSDPRRWRGEAIAAWREAVRGAQGTPPWPLVGRVAAALDDRDVRDAVLVDLVGADDAAVDAVAAGVASGRRLEEPDPPAVPSATASAGAGHEVDVDRVVERALAVVVDPVRGRAPDPAALAAGRAVLEAVAGSLPARRTAPALTLLAVLAWWEGDGGLARERLEAAVAADPGHRLAQVLAPAIVGGLAPGWVRAAGTGPGSV